MPAAAPGQPIAMEDGGEGSSAEEHDAALAEAVDQRATRLQELAATVGKVLGAAE